MKHDFHILMLEDDAADAELTKFTLRKSGMQFSVSRVETREDYLQALEERTRLASQFVETTAGEFRQAFLVFLRACLAAGLHLCLRCLETGFSFIFGALDRLQSCVCALGSGLGKLMAGLFINGLDFPAK